MIQVKQISAKDCYAIRQQVLWQHKDLDDCGIEIDEQEDSFHLGAFLKDELVTIASFFKQKHFQFTAENQYRLRAMASLPKAQHKGAAKALLKHAFEKLQNQEQDLMWCDARSVAVGFYEKLGFSKIGEQYEIPIIGPHYLMVKNLSSTIFKSEEDWKLQLSPEAYKILREKGTELPFTGKYNAHFKKGMYCCAACQEPLFDSSSKFDSRCGWPSFDAPLKAKLTEIPDYSHQMVRVEIVCSHCDSHLGHVFKDGPTATGMRYCVNSLSLDFVEVKNK